MTCDRRTVLASGVALLFPASGLSSPPDPAEPIRSLETVLAGSAGGPPTDAAVRTAVDRFFDLQAIADAALADYAGEVTAAQRERFRAALGGRIAIDLLDRRRASGRGTLNVVQTRPAGVGEWLVDTRVEVPGQSARTLRWRVRQTAGRPRIVDVVVNGSAMVRLFRNEYAVALRRVGLEGLISRMEARNRRARG